MPGVGHGASSVTVSKDPVVRERSILSGPIPRPVALLSLLAAARADSQCSVFLRTYQMQPPD